MQGASPALAKCPRGLTSVLPPNHLPGSGGPGNAVVSACRPCAPTGWGVGKGPWQWEEQPPKDRRLTCAVRGPRFAQRVEHGACLMTALLPRDLPSRPRLPSVTPILHPSPGLQGQREFPTAGLAGARQAACRRTQETHMQLLRGRAPQVLKDRCCLHSRPAVAGAPGLRERSHDFLLCRSGGAFQ